MDVTVAICTCNRAASLDRTLASFVAMTHPPDWELLVVMNRCTDDTPAVVARYADRLPVRAIPDDGPGLPAARNTALAEASGRYLVFTDDDVVVDPGWLVGFLAAFARWPDAAMFAGRVDPVLEGTPPGWMVAGIDALDAMLARRDFGPQPCALSADDDRVPYGASLACRVDQLRRFGFDPSRGPGGDARIAGAETHTMKQMLRAGLTGVWVPDVVVSHMIAPGRQRLGYVFAHYRRSGETMAAEEVSGNGRRVLGAPPWLWWRVAVRAARLAILRLTGPAAAWVLATRMLAVDYGRLLGWRRPTQEARRAGRSVLGSSRTGSATPDAASL